MNPIFLSKPALKCAWLKGDDNNDNFYHIMTSNTLYYTNPQITANHSVDCMLNDHNINNSLQ